MADLQQVLKEIQSEDMNDWYKATQEAGPLGAKAVKPLADLMKLDDRTKGRAAKLSLQAVVHYSAAPGNEAEKKAVAAELLKVAAATYPRMVRSDVLYFLGLVGGPEQVPGIAKLLNDRTIREDARIALERIPGDESLESLKKAASSGPTDFRRNIAQSLHNRSLTKDTVGIKATAGTA